MGDKASSTDARGLRAQLEGLNSAEQQKVAYQWALANDKFMDLLGDFANERKLLIFKSGNECENWIDPVLNLVYKMNTLMHVGGNIAKLFERIEQFNLLFPSTALRFVGFQAMSSGNVYPIFVQPFISNSRFATDDEICEYMNRIGFKQMDEEGYFENDMYILSDIKPKNVLCIDGDMYVIDAEISRK